MADDNHLMEELKEDDQLVKIQAWWEKNRKTVITSTIVAVVIATIGVAINNRIEVAKAEVASEFFKAKILLSNKSSANEGIHALRKIGNKHKEYKALCLYTVANYFARKSEKKSKAEYAKLLKVADLDKNYRDLAIIKTGYMRLNDKDFVELLPQLEQIAKMLGPWQMLAKELLALNADRTNKHDKANAQYNEIINDTKSSANTKYRARAYQQSNKK